MRLMEVLGHALRSVRSDESKMLSADSSAESAGTILNVTCAAFKEGGLFPVKFTCDGDSLFPGISWSKPPENAISMLLVVEDPDIPNETPFIHGIVYNIPPKIGGLPADSIAKDGSVEASFASIGIKCGGNSIGQAKYMAPSPPPGHGDHHYFFQVFALDKKLNFESMPKMPDIKDAIVGHVIAYGEVMGIYKRGE